jgi:hypothetical protein
MPKMKGVDESVTHDVTLFQEVVIYNLYFNKDVLNKALQQLQPAIVSQDRSTISC